MNPEQLYFCLGIPGPITLKQLGVEGDLTAVLKSGMPIIASMAGMLPFTRIFLRF